MFRKAMVLISVFFMFVLFNVQAGSAAGPKIAQLAEKASPAVVNISTVKMIDVSKRLRRFFSPFPEGHPFNRFFQPFQGMPQKKKSHSLGSGFIISPDGYIVTNHHVVAKAEEIQVSLQDSEKNYTAEVIGSDEETDLALLKIEAERDLPTLEFGSSEDIKPGEWVVAIGNPFGLSHTVTAGIISAKGRSIGAAGPYTDFLQTDASINPGNSGGPLLNMEGKVIGINTAIVPQGQGIGFAIPSDMAQNVISQLKKYKEVRRGWLGVTIQDVDQNTAKALGLSEEKGALVASVQKGDPADKAGIKSGDVILQVNGQTINEARELSQLIGGLKPGAKVDMQIWRQGKTKQVQVTLGQRKGGVATSEPSKLQEKLAKDLGITLRPLRPQEARALGLDKATGLLVTDSQVEGLREGDVIVQANGEVVDSLSQMASAVKAAQDKGVILLHIYRRGHNLFQAIPLQ
ncbi:DegQ family serine endoprotease [Desulfovermiculus halophilus]|jgi:serine protease Do|uniref:DegQ family serine endoprotease n=1 Tax=Desulfovermiculus halophilus TaxID=339722 RepID=UPI000488C36F|nr:DegQ family serine endoprotease [Desulfovermiculus halophilus]